jgi:hypothetical protein
MNSDSPRPEFETSQITQDTTLKFELRVTDNNNQADFDTVNIHVIGEKENQKPEADAGDSKTVVEGQSIQLDGTASKDDDGTIVSYEWKSKDCDNEPNGSVQNSQLVNPTFVAPQISSASTICNIELKVIDNGGGLDSDTVEITVKEKPPTNMGQFASNPNLKASQ